MKRNLVGSIYGRSSIKIAHFVPIRHKHGGHRQFLFLIGQFLRIACGGDVYSQNQDETGNLYRGPSIDASYQVLVHNRMAK
jgi:hypothetical protein